jgi:tRNA threonylcarbamoyladenosine biosynthesis protein TsaB
VRVLAFDSCLGACSAALLDERSVLAARYEEMPRGQAERLVPMVEEVRAEAGLAWSAIDLICVTIGPGSFTGVRIGLAAAQGFALVADLPILGLTTLEALAGAAPPDRPVLAAIDARRGQLYAQPFAPGLRPLAPPQALSPEQAAALAPPGAVVLGSGAPLLKKGGSPLFAEEKGTVPFFPDAAIFGRLGFARTGEASRVPPKPLYLRGADAKLPGT